MPVLSAMHRDLLPMPHLSANRVAAMLCWVFIALGLFYSANTPLFEGPDELAHFVYAHRTLTDQSLPIMTNRTDMFDQRHMEIHQLPLYYLSIVPFIAPFDRTELESYFRFNPFASVGSISYNNENTQLYPVNPPHGVALAVWTARLVSLAFGASTLLCVYHVGRLIAGESVGLAAMLLAASIPQFVHVSASVNNDNLNILLVNLAILWSVRLWVLRRLTRLELLWAALISGGISLAKLTGFIAYPIMVGTVCLALLTRRIRVRDALLACAAVGGGALLLGGWWYLRNVRLYDHWLAFEVTSSLWGRSTQAVWPTARELWGVWNSFWYTMGHLNIPPPPWFVPYTSAITALGVLGALVAWGRGRYRWELVFLFAVQALVWGMLIYITRQINISQGRALFMGIAAFAPLLVIGWRALLPRRIAAVWIAPLTVLALAAPLTDLARVFQPLQPLDRVPEGIQRIDARAESLFVYGLDLLTPVVAPDGEVLADVYFSGNHPENPAMFITAADPRTGERLGGIDTYPGLTATDWLPEGQIYRARLRFQLTPSDDPRPFRLDLVLGWRIPDARDPGAGRFVEWFNADMQPIGGAFFNGAVVVDRSYRPTPPAHALNTVFGEQIRLLGCTLIPAAEDSLSVTLVWQPIQRLNDDWTLTVGIVEPDGTLSSQEDASPRGYPTSAWQQDIAFETVHLLKNNIPPDREGEGRKLRVGWYLQDGGRLTVSAAAESSADGLLLIPLEACFS